jgi:hypothetical protein
VSEGYRNEKKKGWLVNKSRMNRRETDNTMVSDDAMQLIKKIEAMSRYTKYSDDEVDMLIRLRDEAMVAVGWLWFKRGNEILGVRVGQISIVKVDDEDNIQVEFHVQKKQRTIKECPFCKMKKGSKEEPTQNAKTANFCRNCGKSLKDVEPVKVGKNYRPVKKHRLLSDPFVKYILAWHEYAKKYAKEEDFLFPPYLGWKGFNFGHVNENKKEKRKVKVGGMKEWKEIDNNYYHLSIQRLDQILSKLDPTMTSSMFRYGHTEVVLRKGYHTTEVKKIGDWNSITMPERYAERKGLSQADKKFALDLAA